MTAKHVMPESVKIMMNQLKESQEAAAAAEKQAAEVYRSGAEYAEDIIRATVECLPTEIRKRYSKKKTWKAEPIAHAIELFDWLHKPRNRRCLPRGFLMQGQIEEINSIHGVAETRCWRFVDQRSFDQMNSRYDFALTEDDRQWYENEELSQRR